MALVQRNRFLSHTPSLSESRAAASPGPAPRVTAGDADLYVRWLDAADAAEEEGLEVNRSTGRIAALAAFTRRLAVAHGAHRAPVVGFMEDGRVEITFVDLSSGARRVTYFVNEGAGTARRITLYAGDQTEAAVVPYR